MPKWENIRHDSSITTIRRVPSSAERAVWSQAATQVMTTGRAGEWYTALRSTTTSEAVKSAPASARLRPGATPKFVPLIRAVELHSPSFSVGLRRAV